MAACCALVGGLLAPWLGGWVENLGFPLGFSGFLEGEANMSPSPPQFGLPASGAVFFPGKGSGLGFSLSGELRSPTGPLFAEARRI